MLYFPVYRGRELDGLVMMRFLCAVIILLAVADFALADSAIKHPASDVAYTGVSFSDVSPSPTPSPTASINLTQSPTATQVSMFSQKMFFDNKPRKMRKP